MSRQLTERETAVLRAIGAHTDAGTEGDTSAYVLACEVTAAGVATTEPGLRSSAAALARKYLIVRTGTGQSTRYRVTEFGRRLLQGDRTLQWRTRDPGGTSS